MDWLDAVGWGGSAVLIWSLAQSSVLRFRALNLAASLVLTGFNAAIEVWPMVAMNAVIAGINVYFLVRLWRTRDDDATYEVVPVGPDEDYLRHVLRRHARDIERHNPGFDWDATSKEEAGRAAFLVVRDTETVGVVLLSGGSAGGAQRDGGQRDGQIELDYVLPRFRDFTPGQFVYRRGGQLGDLGFDRLLAPSRMVDAATYFPRVGFRADGDRLVLDVGGSDVADDQRRRSSSTATSPPNNAPTRPSTSAR